MTEVILNDECAQCTHKECHDGENFCRQAMKKNSFYKNAKLYKGLEVIQSPTYKELEQENAKLRKELKEWKDEWQEQEQKANDEGWERTKLTGRVRELERENAELKEKLEHRNCLDCSNHGSNIKLLKAKKHIKQLLDCLKQDTNDPETNYYVCQYMDKAEQFLRR